MHFMCKYLIILFSCSNVILLILIIYTVQRDYQSNRSDECKQRKYCSIRKSGNVSHIHGSAMQERDGARRNNKRDTSHKHFIYMRNMSCILFTVIPYIVTTIHCQYNYQIYLRIFLVCIYSNN